MTTKILSFKAPGEAITATFDFSPYIGAASISGTPTVTCARDAGAGINDPATMISGTATAVTGVVSQKIVGGTALDDYRLTCTALLSDARTLILASILPVRVA